AEDLGLKIEVLALRHGEFPRDIAMRHLRVPVRIVHRVDGMLGLVDEYPGEAVVNSLFVAGVLRVSTYGILRLGEAGQPLGPWKSNVRDAERPVAVRRRGDAEDQVVLRIHHTQRR